MVLPGLTSRRRLGLAVVLASLPVVASCSGGSSGAAADGSTLARQACDVFLNFKAPAGSGRQAEIDYAKASYVRFLKAADLARQAAGKDPRWDTLRDAAQREAAAFEVVVTAADAKSAASVNPASVQRAAEATKAARPVFVAECVKADPAHFKLTSSSSPSPAVTG